MAYCKSCAKKNHDISGFADASLELAAGAAAGAVTAGLVDKYGLDKLDSDPASFLGSNPTLSNIVKAAAKGALGVYLMGMDGELVKGVGTGMVAQAGYKLVQSYMPNMIGDLGTPPLRIGNAYHTDPYNIGYGPMKIGQDVRQPMHQPAQQPVQQPVQPQPMTVGDDIIVN